MGAEKITSVEQMLARKPTGKYECDVVHLAAAKWLADNDYTFEYEVLMPQKGRVDFLAYKAGTPYIVECKVGCDAFDLAIAQAHGYREQIEGAKIIIAVPKSALTRRAQTLAKFTAVNLIGVDHEADNQRVLRELPHLSDDHEQKFALLLEKLTTMHKREIDEWFAFHYAIDAALMRCWAHEDKRILKEETITKLAELAEGMDMGLNTAINALFDYFKLTPAELGKMIGGSLKMVVVDNPLKDAEHSAQNA